MNIQFTIGMLYGAYLAHAIDSRDSRLILILLFVMVIVINYAHFCGRQIERERYD